MIPSNKTRLWLTVFAFVCNCLLAYAGITKNSELMSLGALLGAVDTLVLYYIYGETKRPSGMAPKE